MKLSTTRSVPVFLPTQPRMTRRPPPPLCPSREATANDVPPSAMKRATSARPWRRSRLNRRAGMRDMAQSWRRAPAVGNERTPLSPGGSRESPRAAGPSCRTNGTRGAASRFSAGLEQIQAAGRADRLVARGGAELAPDPLAVRADGVQREVETVGDLAVGEVRRQQLQHALLGGAQERCGVGVRDRRRRLAYLALELARERDQRWHARALQLCLGRV